MRDTVYFLVFDSLADCQAALAVSEIRGRSSPPADDIGLLDGGRRRMLAAIARAAVVRVVDALPGIANPQDAYS